MPHVRPLTVADRPEFLPLRLHSVTEHPECYATTAENVRSAPLAKTDALLSAGATGSVVFGAFDEALVGVLGCKRDDRETVDHYATLWGFFLHQDARGRGLGAALLTAAIEHARGLGLDYLRLGVPVSSDAALRVFEAQGFTRYGLEVGARKMGARRIDQAYLRLGL